MLKEKLCETILAEIESYILKNNINKTQFAILADIPVASFRNILSRIKQGNLPGNDILDRIEEVLKKEYIAPEQELNKDINLILLKNIELNLKRKFGTVKQASISGGWGEKYLTNMLSDLRKGSSFPSIPQLVKIANLCEVEVYNFFIIDYQKGDEINVGI